MLEILPALAWLAAITSGVLLVVLWTLGGMRRRALAVLLGWFLIAAYGQFLAGSVAASTVGLLAQTILAVYLLVRWKLAD